MEFQKKFLLIAGVGLLLGASNLSAVEKTARGVMNNAYKYIDKLKDYSFDAIVVDKSIENGELIGKYNHKVSVKVSRPNMLRVDIKGDFKNSTNYLNSGLFTIIDHNDKYYGQLKTPKNINKALDFIFDKYGIKSPLASLIYTDMGKRAKFSRSKYFGVDTINGVKCDYIAFKKGSREVHIWVAVGDKPIVKYYTEINEFYKINTTIFWNNKKIVPSDFEFIAPKNASKISIEPTE